MWRVLVVAAVAAVGLLLAAPPAVAQDGEEPPDTTTSELPATTSEPPTTEAPSTTETPTTVSPPPTEAPPASAEAESQGVLGGGAEEPEQPDRGADASATSARPRVTDVEASGDDVSAPSTLLAPVATVLAQDAPTTTVAAPTEVAESNVEKVTTTEGKVRRVVIGLVAIGVVSAVLTLAFARHTSPRRRAAAWAGREELRERRLAAAATVGGLGDQTVTRSGVWSDPSARPPDAAADRRIAPPGAVQTRGATGRRRGSRDPEVAGRHERTGPPDARDATAAPPRRDRSADVPADGVPDPRPNPRPQPRRRDPDAASG